MKDKTTRSDNETRIEVQFDGPPSDADVELLASKMMTEQIINCIDGQPRLISVNWSYTVDFFC